MPFLNYDGVLVGGAQRAWWTVPLPPVIFLLSTQDTLTVNSGLDSQIGNPAPGFKLSFGRYRIRLPVKPGIRTVSVDVFQPIATAERPVLRVKFNTDIGLSADVSATAGAAINWQTITLVFTATANGAVIAELENPDAAKPCWFDNLKIQ
jgi:hypothetical protein